MKNGKAVLSGIDHIDAGVTEDEAMIFDLPKGYYSVSVYLLGWDEEPGHIWKMEISVRMPFQIL